MRWFLGKIINEEVCTYFLNHVNRQHQTELGHIEKQLRKWRIGCCKSIHHFFIWNLRCGLLFSNTKKQETNFKSISMSFQLLVWIWCIYIQSSIFSPPTKNHHENMLQRFLLLSLYVRSILQVKHLHFMKPSCLRLYHISSSQKKGRLHPDAQQIVYFM